MLLVNGAWFDAPSVPEIWLLAGTSVVAMGISMRNWWPWWESGDKNAPPETPPKRPSGLEQENASLRKQVNQLEQQLEQRQQQLEQQQQQLDELQRQLEHAQQEFQQAGRGREKLVRELLDLIQELHRLGQSQDVAAPLARHVVHTLFQALERSGVEVIRSEPRFDPRRHWPVPFDDSAQPGHPVAETLRPGVALDGQVLLRAEVRLAEQPDASSHSQETSDG